MELSMIEKVMACHWQCRAGCDREVNGGLVAGCIGLTVIERLWLNNQASKNCMTFALHLISYSA